MYNSLMLDDLKYIHQKDGQDALGIAEKQFQQLLPAYELPAAEGNIGNIVFSGMGGSALAALLSTTWPGYKVPFEIIRNYSIPTYVGPETLFIASSYSGNTEETIEALGHAEGQGAKIAIITSGGQLAETAKAKNYPLALIPGGLQPRYAVLHSFKALADILVKYGLADAALLNEELQKASEFLRTAVEWWRPDVPTKDNYPKQIALELMGKSPVVYAGPLMFPAAYKWKISFNENAKNVAWCNQLPEFNHNEFLGWTSHPTDKPYAVICLRSSFEHPRVQKRFELSERMLSGMRPRTLNIDSLGENVLQHLLWLVAFGDFVSLYLALLNGLNPTPVDLIEKFKRELNS